MAHWLYKYNSSKIARFVPHLPSIQIIPSPTNEIKFKFSKLRCLSANQLELTLKSVTFSCCSRGLTPLFLLHDSFVNETQLSSLGDPLTPRQTVSSFRVMCFYSDHLLIIYLSLFLKLQSTDQPGIVTSDKGTFMLRQRRGY